MIGQLQGTGVGLWLDFEKKSDFLPLKPKPREEEKSDEGDRN
jgi:hypothetical protein